MVENTHQKRNDIYVEKFRHYLKQSNSLSDEMINIFVSAGKFRKYKKGEIFSKQGESYSKSAYICTGMFNVFCTQEDGTLFVVAFLKDSDFVQSRFDFSAPCNVSIQSLCDTVVIEYQTNVLQSMYLQYPQLGNFIRHVAEKYILIYGSHMIQIGTKKAIDNYLLFQQSFQGDAELIPQHLVAAYLGITPTQLSRIRKQLSDAQQSPESILQ